ncbi:MAG: CapA family protein [Pyrinomonadaceae bacterium]
MSKPFLKLLRWVIATLVVGAVFLFWAGERPYRIFFPGEPEPVEVEPRSDDRSATFVAVGDIMLSRGVAKAILKSGTTNYPFEKLTEILLRSDLNFGNLESPVSGNDHVLGEGLVFNARRDHATALAKYNFKIVNLANNHAFDQGLKGLLATRGFLDNLGVRHIGVGEDEGDAWRPAVLDVNGIKIAFIGASYASINDGGVVRKPNVARIEDQNRLAAAIQRAKIEDADYIVVTMHAGIEYTREPEKGQIAFARAAVDVGADIVIGAHPHWVQTTEIYRGKPIFYSLGNFVFDQRPEERRKGLILRIKLRGSELDEIEMLPVIIDNSAPRLATADESREILRKIGVTDPILRP